MPAIPVGPAYGLADSAYAYSTSAFDPDGDSVAVEFDWGVSATTEKTGFMPGGTPVIRYAWWRSPGIYNIRARALDTRGGVSNWTSDVEVEVVHPDSLPLRPLRPEGPDSVRVGFIEEFSFPTRGPPGESLLLAFDWGDGRVSEHWELSCRAGETLKARQAFWKDGDWYVRAMALDGGKRTYSRWSAGKRTKVRSRSGSGWSMCYDAENANALAPTYDGGYILALEQGWGICLAKTDMWGRQQWMMFSDTVEASGLSVRQTADSGYIVVGSWAGFPSSGFDLVRTDKFGDLLWFKSYDMGASYGSCVRPTPDGGYVVGGGSVLLKTDSSGDSVWARECEAVGVELMPDGGYISCGGWRGAALTKTDASGSAQWSRVYGGQDAYAVAVRVLADGDFILVGGAGWMSGTESAYMARIASSGELVWERKYPGVKSGAALDVCQTSDGGFCLAGMTDDWRAPLLIRTDARGTLEWQQEVSPCSYVDHVAVLPTADDGCVMAAAYGEYDEDQCAVLFKVDENGGIGPAGYEAGLPAGAGLRCGARTAQRARAQRLRSAMRGR